MIDDNHIKQKFNSNQIHNSKIKSLNNDELNYLTNRYNDSLSIKETIFRILNNIDIHPVCPECGKLCKVKYRKNQPFYSTCGNIECIHKRKGNGPKEKCIQKYGVENQFQRKEIKDKIRQTCLNKWGHNSHMQSTSWQNNYKQHLLNKYGVENQFQRKEIKDKIRQTCLNKYGVEHYNQSNIFKQQMSIIASSKEFQEKRNNTLKQNNTWKSSKDEEYCYNELCKYFKHVERQYSSILYPFNCDFYIPEIDTYIEYQGSDLHNGRKYVGDTNDLIEVNILKEKSKKLKLKNNTNKKTRYDLRIYTWTDLDVRKRNIAKDNNLNFVELWNLKELNQWLQTYKINYEVYI